jgi:hypothetical protein
MRLSQYYQHYTLKMIQNNEEKEGIDVSPVTIDSALKNRNKA